MDDSFRLKALFHCFNVHTFLSIFTVFRIVVIQSLVLISEKKSQLQSCIWPFGTHVHSFSTTLKKEILKKCIPKPKYGLKCDLFVFAIPMCIDVLYVVHVCQMRAHWRINESTICCCCFFFAKQYYTLKEILQSLS